MAICFLFFLVSIYFFPELYTWAVKAGRAGPDHFEHAYENAFVESKVGTYSEYQLFQSSARCGK